ncbi:MAG: peptidase S1 [Alphaproteobacteria bacterium]
MNRIIQAFAALGAAATVMIGLQAQAQMPNWQAVPRYHTFNLNAGFRPDPQFIDVQAGGSGAANRIGPACVGFIDFSKPDVDLNYGGGQYSLSIWAEGAGDLTLVVYDPVGQWYCNDDYRGLDPAIQFGNPQSGNYNIWVGSHQGIQPARLYITERPPFTY